MRNSLIFKLMGAFLLVIAIGAGVIAWLTSKATQSAFALYTTRNSQAWGQHLAPILADYYSANQGWQGVESVLQSELASPLPTGSGNGQGRGMGAGRQGGIWTMGQRVIIASENGSVISDTSGELVGQRLSAGDLSSGAPVVAGGSQVGTVVVSPNDFAGASTAAGQFLASVNQSIVLSAIAAGVIALLLGAGLFFQITAPLRQLNKAASAIAQGDLSQRVSIHSTDEFGSLGQTFNLMAENLDRAQTQRQHLMADVAHELRTPIAVIQANLEAMLDEVLPLNSEQVAALHDETLLLNRLVGDLRLISLAEAGELKLEKRLVEFGALLSLLVDRLHVQAQQNGIALELDIPQNLPPIWVDADRIIQVMNNLIGNALRYTPMGGQIVVHAEKLPGSPASIRVSVTDTGPGIDPAALPFVFDRFYRADQSRARASGGSGLGLAIVNQLVEAHGGRVEVASPAYQRGGEPGYGTRFSFTLPG